MSCISLESSCMAVFWVRKKWLSNKSILFERIFFPLSLGCLSITSQLKFLTLRLSPKRTFFLIHLWISNIQILKYIWDFLKRCRLDKKNAFPNKSLVRLGYIQLGSVLRLAKPSKKTAELNLSYPNRARHYKSSPSENLEARRLVIIRALFSTFTLKRFELKNKYFMIKIKWVYFLKFKIF